MESYVAATLTLTVALSIALGANNFSTCLGASIGARIVRLRDAMLIASVGVFLGPLLEGAKLADVSDTLITSQLSSVNLAVILLTSLLIMTVVTLLRLPLSLAQIIVGACWGVAMSAGISIDLNYSFEVVVSWVLSPAVAFLASAAIEHGALRLSRTAKDILALNRLWATLTLLAGFYASYTLGANTIGLLLGLFPEGHLEPLLLSLLCSSGAVAGIVFLSKGTARSVAENVVGLTPSTAMSAQFGGALSTHLFTQLGMPVSTSQVVVGGMTGAASVKRYSITNRRTLLEIVSGWTVGPLAGAAIAFLILEIM